jgi:hypothetical protein
VRVGHLALADQLAGDVRHGVAGDGEADARGLAGLDQDHRGTDLLDDLDELLLEGHRRRLGRDRRRGRWRAGAAGGARRAAGQHQPRHQHGHDQGDRHRQVELGRGGGPPPAAVQDQQAEQHVKGQQPPGEGREQVHLGRGHVRGVAQPDQQPLHAGAGEHQGEPDRDAPGGVPQPVQQRHQQVRPDDGAAEPQPAAAGGDGEQRPPEDRRPQPVPDRGQDAPQHLGLDQGAQRRAAGGEQGVEGIAGALEGGEAEPDRRPEHDPVAHGVAGQAAGQQPQRGQLDRLLDQPHPDIGRPGRLAQEHGLQHRGAQHTEHPAVDEGGEDALGGDDLVGAAEGIGDEGHRDEEAAEQDDGRDEVGVAGGEGHQHGGHPEPEAAQEQVQPGSLSPCLCHGVPPCAGSRVAPGPAGVATASGHLAWWLAGIPGWWLAEQPGHQVDGGGQDHGAQQVRQQRLAQRRRPQRRGVQRGI